MGDRAYVDEASAAASAQFSIKVGKGYAWRLTVALFMVGVLETPGALVVGIVSGITLVLAVFGVITETSIWRILALLTLVISVFVLVIIPGYVLVSSYRGFASSVRVGETRTSQITHAGITIRNAEGAVSARFADCARTREFFGFLILVRSRGLPPFAIPAALFPRPARAQVWTVQRTDQRS